ncbi:helix-turn-helix domain-containing protein [Pararhodobacter oceanensis]
MSDAALEVIRRYNWPGNVRQLEHMVQRLMITGHDPEIAATEVEAVLGAASTGAAPTHGNDGGTLAESVARHVRRYFELHGDELPPSGVYQRIMREVEAPLLDIALEYSGGNQLRCAELLGINRNTLRKKTNELDISVTRRRKLM